MGTPYVGRSFSGLIVHLPCLRRQFPERTGLITAGSLSLDPARVYTLPGMTNPVTEECAAVQQDTLLHFLRHWRRPSRAVRSAPSVLVN